MRYHFPNGWFVGAEGGGMGLSGINQGGAFGNIRPLYSEGVQFGYNFQTVGNLPDHGLCRFQHLEVQQCQHRQPFCVLRLHLHRTARL